MYRIVKSLLVLIGLVALAALFGCATAQKEPAVSKQAAPSIKQQVQKAGFQLVEYDYVRSKVGNGLRNFEEVVLIDARPEFKYQSGHIPTALNIPDRKFDEYAGQLQDVGASKSTELIIYCGGYKCTKSLRDARMLRERGYQNIKVYLAGMPDWKKHSYTEITIGELEKHLRKGHTLIDARPERKFKQEAIRGAVSIPASEFKYKEGMRDDFLAKLPADKDAPIVVYCGGYICKKSHIVSQLLVQEYGYTNVANFSGGLPQWKEQGKPTVAGGESEGTATTAAKTSTTLKTGADKATLDIEVFKSMLKDKPEDVTIVDVRSPEEYEQWKVPGAMHLHVENLYKEGCDFVTSELPDQGPVVFVCTTGSRSGEMYYGLTDCQGVDMDRFYFVDAQVDCSGEECSVE